MKRALLTLATVLWASVSVLADQTTESVQQALKDQGFYYGDVTGQKNADTTAAIRRYQIRNGLQITGEMDAETLRSLGIGSSAAKAPSPPSATPDTSDLRAPEAAQPTPRPNQRPEGIDQVPGPHGLQPETSGVFDDTPYAIAPPDLQRHVIVGVQTLLAGRGLYRSAIDGLYGAGTAFAVRAFQSRVGIPPTGRLDMETLAALSLLPGQHAPGISVPPRRFQRYHAPLPGQVVPY
ncbi:MAG TPA: peptidoglycan-binding domain-containing protein [Chthoniobacterales bacterium]